MKKSYLIVGALLALAACTKEPVVETQSPKDGLAYLTFRSERPQFDATKTAWNGSTIVWTTGDKIKVGFTFGGNWWGQTAAYSAENATPNNHKKFYQSDGVSIDAKDASVGTFSVPTSFTGDESNGEYVFYALYPAAAMAENDQDSAPVVKVNLKTTQTPAADSFDGSTDIMVGKSESIISTGLPKAPIDLTWTRVVAHGLITFKDLRGVEAGETITEITLTAQEGANLTGNQRISLENGVISTSNGGSNVVRIEGDNLSFVTDNQMTNIKAWISILPETIESLAIDIETNKANYTRTITGFSKTFKQNAKNDLSIVMGPNATRTSKTADPRLFDDGNYLMTITSSQGGDRMMSASSSTPQKAIETSTEIESGVYKADKDAVWNITYNSTDGTYSIKSVGKDQYLSGSSSATSLSLDDDPVFFSATEVSNGVYNFSVSGAGSTRFISYNYNSGSDRFALYNNDDDYIKDITLLPAVAKEEQPIEEEPKAGTDVLNYAFTSISGTSYAEWGPKKGSVSNAYYIGQSGGQNNSIQLRTNNSNSGIVVSKSSGYVKSITVTWNDNTADGRTLDIYGKHTAFSATTDLYDSSKQGAKVGSIKKGSSTTYTFTTNYEYIGLRSSSGAMFIDKVEIEWVTDAISGTGETKTATIKSTRTGNAVQNLDSLTETDKDITAVFNKNNAQNGIYESATQIRVYEGNTITLSGGTITGVTVTCSTESYNKGFTANIGSGSSSGVEWKWTGSSTDLVLTSNGSSRIQSIEVKYN